MASTILDKHIAPHRIQLTELFERLRSAALAVIAQELEASLCPRLGPAADAGRPTPLAVRVWKTEETAAPGVDVTSQPTASRSSANNAVECDPRPSGRTRRMRVLSQQTFRPHGFLHLRPCTDSSHVCLDVRPFCEIDLVDIGPVEHREQIGVGHRVFVAGNELVAVEQLLESIETTPDHAQLDLLHFRRQVRVEERADLLVYFGRCEVQRFHQAVALHGSRLGNKPGLGFLVAEVLADDRDLGQDLSVVQHESRNVALGVDLPIIAAVGGLLVGDVNPLEIEGVSGFASHDVRGHGAGAGGVVELHVQFLSGLLIGRTAVHSGKDPAFVAYDQFLSTGILQPLSRGEVRCGS
jgi:hypothetical protein